MLPTGSPAGCPASSSRMPSVLSSTPLIAALRFVSSVVLNSTFGSDLEYNSEIELSFESVASRRAVGSESRGRDRWPQPQASWPRPRTRAQRSTSRCSAPEPAEWRRRSSPRSTGQRVLLVERTEYLGGTSALSAATTWVPGTRLAATVGADDSREKVSGLSRPRRRQPRAQGAARGLPRRRARGDPHAPRQDRGAVPRPPVPPRLPLRARRLDLLRPRARARALRRPRARPRPRAGPPADPRVHHPRRHGDRPRRHQAPAEDEDRRSNPSSTRRGSSPATASPACATRATRAC